VVGRSHQTARQLIEQAKAAPQPLATSYPNTELARQRSLISLMIKAEIAARVYYVAQPGYDIRAVIPKSQSCYRTPEKRPFCSTPEIWLAC
jgi:hypothetical protein